MLKRQLDFYARYGRLIHTAKYIMKGGSSMNLTMLGTGHAFVTECYNTCFVMHERSQFFLIDGGGGNTLLKQLKSANISWKEIKTIFVTHKHIDHVTGILWLIRLICEYMSLGEYEGDVHIYAHTELIKTIQNISNMLLQEKEAEFIGKRLFLVPVTDRQEVEIIGYKTAFFDIQSKKARQYGFTMFLEHNEKLTCCGDEPYHDSVKYYAENSKWFLHEAFCLHSQADLFHPYEKHHSTVKEACQIAEQLKVKNLLLYHTEDTNIGRRKELYTAEGSKYFSGNLYIPDDLETIKIQ